MSGRMGGMMRPRAAGGRPNSSRGGERRESLEDTFDPLTQQPVQDEMSEDDNAAPDMASEAEMEATEKEDPLLLAIDDLEGRVVSALDDFKLHPGVRSSSAPGSPSVHEELATLLRPVLEVAAHTGPSVARTYYQPTPGGGDLGVEASCDDVYQRVVSDLVLPVLLEEVQSATIPAKRTASLEFFHNLWKECHKAGSWLDSTTAGPNAGPYSSGGGSLAVPPSMSTPAVRAQQKRRQGKKLAKDGEILRYWVEASIACTLPGAFTNDASEGAVASRGVIAASASLRPSLRHIAQRIQDADDRGAAKLYGPVMKMIEGVVKKLFLTTSTEAGVTGDALRSACIKFLEIVVLSCSSKAQPGAHAAARRRGRNMEDFSLEDLPAGHPVITREALESVAEYAFTALRGLTLMGGQVKIDVNLLSDMMLSGGGDNSPSSQVVSILKPAALAYLEIESSAEQDNAEESLEFKVNRSDIDFEFTLSQKSYALAINAISVLAMNRPIFYKEAATILARRAANPPKYVEGGPLTKGAVLAIGSQLRASCLTLLRNVLSITTNGFELLHKALTSADMGLQADKALSMARQAAALKTAGRAARNRAAMFYEWDSSDKRVSKRQRETDDALAKMRAAKAARGLGSGIQLPTSMSDSIELVLLNLTHLPSSRPATGAGVKARKQPISLEYVVDAVMTNGASLSQDEGRWYDRDGGTAWLIDMTRESHYELDPKTLSTVESEYSTVPEKPAELDNKAAKEQKKQFQGQCQSAVSDAFSRIVRNSSQARSKPVADLGNQIAARLAWTLKNVQPSSELKTANEMAKESITSINSGASKELAGDDSLEEFAKMFPLVCSCLALNVTPGVSATSQSSGIGDSMSSLSNRVLNEGYLESCAGGPNEKSKYEKSLAVFASAVVHASARANEKPSDNDRKKIASLAASSLPQQLAVLPSVTPSALTITSFMCDIDEITKKAAEAARKSSQQTLAASAAAHAAKVAAEKRATAALLVLRDAAFQRTQLDVRRSAVGCAVAVAAGRFPASASVEDKALKLVMNVLFPKSELLAEAVVEAAKAELEQASKFAVENYDKIQKANREAKSDGPKKNAFAPASDTEKEALDRVRKPAVLFMALSVRRPEMIKSLMSICCKEKADVLSKAVRNNMPKLTRAVATKFGAPTIALQVSEMASDEEVPMLLAFLDNLAPSTDKVLPGEELIEAMHQIQDSRKDSEGKKDPRFIIPVVSAMKRQDLVTELPQFVGAEDDVFMAALVRMSDRVGRHALFYRDEPDKENPSLHGMTLCEQLVFLHKLDFSGMGLPQKRYLDAIRLCLDEDEVFTDRVVMAALDYMSGTFLAGEDKLPLAYMRTIILTCSKHESLHSWICHVLLPRLIEGKVYTDRRQWEGWMRCAKMLENTGDSGVSSLEAIQKLPSEQLLLYRAKYPQQS